MSDMLHPANLPHRPLPAKIVAIVPTFNRLGLLQECVDAIRNQTRKPDAIVVINNGSSDGTKEWLDTQPDLRVIHQANLGGAGGFFAGQKCAVEEFKADAVWGMDDDTIPTRTALAELLTAWQAVDTKGKPMGWICSTIEWTDGSVTNSQAFPEGTHADLIVNHSAQVVRSRWCSFVSVLMPAEVLRKLGYVRRNMVFQGDDVEHSTRIFNAGYWTGTSLRSVVVHKTFAASGPPAKYFGKAKNRLRHCWRNLYDIAMLDEGRSKPGRRLCFIGDVLKQMIGRVGARDWAALPMVVIHATAGMLRERVIEFPEN